MTQLIQGRSSLSSLGESARRNGACVVGVGPAKGVATKPFELRTVDLGHARVLSDVTGVIGICPIGMCVVQTPSPKTYRLLKAARAGSASNQIHQIVFVNRRKRFTRAFCMTIRSK